MSKSLGINEKNRKLLDALNRSGKNMFTAKEASNIIGLTIDSTRLFLAYCTRRGWLARVKRGLYTCVPLGTINPQEYKENPFIVANRVFDPCYIGGWSAAEHWGVTEQLFNSVCVFTQKPYRKRKVVIQRTEFVLKHTGKNKTKHTKGVWIENVKVQLSDPEQTLVDILSDPSTGGGIRHVADIVEGYFNSEYFNQNTLLTYIKEFGNKTVYKRLGFILESLGMNSDYMIKVCNENISAGYSVLDPVVDNKGSYSRRWNLRVNVTIR